MPNPQTVEQIKLGYGDRLVSREVEEDPSIQQFAILTLTTRDGQTDFELSPDSLDTLREQVDRVTEALASLRRREARRLSRSRSGWRQGQSY